jgi:sn-glycerol 3-phosphate transport system substrate-binding protein
MRTWSLKAACAAAAMLGMTVPATADVELTMYYPIAVGGPLTQVVDDMIAGFEAENPDVSVNAIYAGNYDDTRVRAISAIQSGDPAQLSVLFSIDVYELLEQDLIVPFDDVVDSEEDEAWLDSFYPALMANGTVDGKVWGVPFQRSTIVLYYNKDMFEEAGLDPDSPPETWDETGRGRQGAAHRQSLGHHGPVHRLSLLDVPGVCDPERRGADERGRHRDLFR